MKNYRVIYVAIALLFISALLASCEFPFELSSSTTTTIKTTTANINNDVPGRDSVEVVITSEDKTYKDSETVVLTSLFTIVADGVAIEVEMSMIDAGGLNTESLTAGRYTIKLTYVSADGVIHTKTATVTIESPWVGPF